MDLENISNLQSFLHEVNATQLKRLYQVSSRVKLLTDKHSNSLEKSRNVLHIA